MTMSSGNSFLSSISSVLDALLILIVFDCITSTLVCFADKGAIWLRSMLLCVMLELTDESSFVMFSIVVALVWHFQLPDAPDAVEEMMDIGVDMTEPFSSSSSALCLLACSI